jgi:hypothetical protein
MRPMHKGFILAVAIGLLALDLSAGDKEGEQTLPSRTRLAEELTRLIAQDAKLRAQAPKEQIRAPHSEETGEGTDTGDIIRLRPMIVTGDKPLPEFSAPSEDVVSKLLRTGTIRQHIGKKTTIRLWTSGNAGLVLSFRR